MRNGVYFIGPPMHESIVLFPFGGLDQSRTVIRAIRYAVKLIREGKYSVVITSREVLEIIVWKKTWWALFVAVTVFFAIQWSNGSSGSAIVVPYE
jgi:hypothetical protein